MNSGWGDRVSRQQQALLRHPAPASFKAQSWAPGRFGSRLGKPESFHLPEAILARDGWLRSIKYAPLCFGTDSSQL